MKLRTIKSSTPCAPQPGTGILHPFPTAQLPHLNPFVFLDTGEPRDIGSHKIYVGPHPHRGVQPVSLLFRGNIRHRDSVGNERQVASGGMQWLVSGAGALHEEYLGGDDEGIFHMAQLWINVPAALKMGPLAHHAVERSDIPEFSSLGHGSSVRLYAGSLAGHTGPAPMPTEVLVAHVALEPGGEITIPTPREWTTAFTVVAGSLACLDETELRGGDTVAFNNDGELLSCASAEGGQFLLMCGEPIDEPIAMGGGFVMNTHQEIEAAFADYRSGAMGSLAPSR